MGMHKYPKIRVLGHKENEGILNHNDLIVFQEKFDGANFRFKFEDGKIIFGSREGIIDENNIPKEFRKCIDYVRQQIQVAEFFRHLNGFCSLKEYGIENYIFYGECMSKHSIEYDWETIPPFILYDIYDIRDRKFIYPFRSFLSEIIFLNFEIVDSIEYNRKLSMGPIFDDFYKWPITKYPPITNKKQLAEGFVIKNYTKQIFAKTVRDDFKEVNNRVKNLINESSTLYIYETYCTLARVIKCINKLCREDGHEMKMELMHLLPTKVYSDIMEEHGQEILYSKFTIDFRLLKKLVSRRCLEILKEIIAQEF